LEKVREQGVASLNEVKASYLEGDGRISVITFKEQGGKGKGQDNTDHGR
jgi:uncharacterized membrane protein YcaP (DUF421 family)